MNIVRNSSSNLRHDVSGEGKHVFGGIVDESIECERKDDLMSSFV